MARPLDPDAKRHVVSCRVNDKTRQWLELWRPGGIPADQLSDVLERAQQFWAAGPDKFGHAGKAKKRTRPIVTPRLKAYAEKQGIEPKDAAADIVRDFLNRQ